MCYLVMLSSVLRVVLRVLKSYQDSKKPVTVVITGFLVVAGKGFEPLTFGL